METQTACGERVLLVDDEPQISRVLRTVLTSRGYFVRVAADGESALSVVKEWQPQLLLTDLRMPRMDGIELCRFVRSVSAIPIIVLSVKGDESSKVEALDAGADDYVTKPFGIDELLARMRSALRRTEANPILSASVFETGVFRVDLDTRRVHIGGREVRLTPKQFDLFVYMARRPNRVLTHASLAAVIWPETATKRPEHIRVFMSQIRKKLESEGDNHRFLVTEPWVGYRFNPVGEATQALAAEAGLPFQPVTTLRRSSFSA